MSEPGDSYLATREQVKRDVLRAFGVKEWQIGLAPVPWWVPYWRKIALPFDLAMARRRGLRRVDGRWVDRDGAR